MNKHFVSTADKDTFEKLIEKGFQLLLFENEKWTFLNDVELDSDIDSDKVVFTDKLYL